MEMHLTLPQEIYNRLEAHARGFDTPADVISRLLDYYETQEGESPSVRTTTPPKVEKSHRLELVFSPADESDFKKAFLEKGVATIKLYRTDGTCSIDSWQRFKFSQSSSIK